MAPRGWENAEGEQTSEGVGGQDSRARACERATHGGVLVTLCRGAKACERITRNVFALRGGDGVGTSEPDPSARASVQRDTKNGKEGLR